jgi:hypothetical protein
MQVVSAGFLAEVLTVVSKFVTIQFFCDQDLNKFVVLRCETRLLQYPTHTYLINVIIPSIHPFPFEEFSGVKIYDRELATRRSNEEFGTGSNHELAPISGPLQ